MQIIKKKWLDYLLLIILLSLPFIAINQGTIHKLDDSLYAQIMKEVSLGNFVPLTYSGEKFSAKPPLLFWLGGLSAKLFGHQDFSYRLLAAISFFLLLLASHLLFKKRGDYYLCWLVPLLLLGSPLLCFFARRVMLDIPLATLSAAIALTAAFCPKGITKYMALGLLASIGWWVKEIAILPSFVGAILALIIIQPTIIKEKKTYLSLTIFAIFALALYFFKNSLNPIYWNSVNSVKVSALEFAAPKGLYRQVILADSKFLLLLPLAMIWGFWQLFSKKQTAALILTIIAILEISAVYYTKTIFPHYLVASLTISLLLVALFLNSLKNRIVRVLVIITALLQLILSNDFRFDSSSFEIDPSADHKQLSQTMAQLVPAKDTICVVDSYFGIFRYYSERQTIGLYTKKKYFAGLARFAEFQKFIFYLPLEQLPARIANQCGNFAIIQKNSLRQLDPAKWKVLEERKTLAIVKLVENKETKSF